MYADAQRVAAAVLHTDVTFEPELRTLLPSDVALYANRVVYPATVTPDSLERAVDSLEPCVTALSAVRPHVIVWACTSGSTLGDRDDHRRLLERLTRWSGGARPVTAAGAVVEALERRGVKRVAIATPYPPQVRDLLVARLRDGGIEVAAVTDAFDEPVDDWTLQALPPDEIAQLLHRADRPEAEAILLSCTGLAAAGVSVEASRAAGKPVITSNVAIAEAVMAALREGPA